MEKGLQKFKRTVTTGPVAVLLVAGVIGAIVYGVTQISRRTGDGPWVGYLYPDKSFSVAPIVQTARELNFHWEQDSPDKAIPADGFAGKWVTCIKLTAPTVVWFSLRADDASQLFVDDKLVIGDWDKPSYGPMQKLLPLAAGVHMIRVENYDISLGALLEFEMRQDNPEGSKLDSGKYVFPGKSADVPNSCPAQ